MTAKTQKDLLLEQIKIDRQLMPNTSLSSSHSMSKKDYLLICNELFDYSSVHVLYNKEIADDEQVCIVIGI